MFGNQDENSYSGFSLELVAHVTNWEEEEELRSKSPISLYFSLPPPAIETPAAAADPVESARS